MATISEADDLRIILSDQRGELMAAETLDSDLDLAFQIQMQEAIAASLALRRPSSPPSDVRNDIVPSSSNVQRDMGDDMHRDEDRDRKHSEAETSKAREDYWSKYKKPYDSSGASSSSSSKCSRLYFKGLVVGERVRDTDMVVAAAGIAICDPEDNLVFQSRKNLEAFDGGEVMTSEAAELEALVEGLNRALSYGFKKIVFFCDDNKIFNYVTNGLPPRNSKVAALVDQVDLLQSKFTYCSPSLVARDNIKFAFKCAREAIVSQITWSEKAGKGKSFKETCLICFEDIDVAQMFSVDGCLHRYCFSCMKQHVEAKLHNGQIARCPHDGCNSELAADSCAKVLPPTLMDVMDQRIKEFSIPDAQKIYCPNPKCSALMSKDEVLEYTKVSIIDAEQTGARKCMKCQKSFCINCKVPWHFDKTCDDYRIENPPIHDDEQMLKSLATEKLWRQCARCNHMIELLEGCSHITCRCKYEFCYTCGAEWKNKRPTCFCPLINHRQQREPLPQPQPQLQQQQLGPGLQQLHQQIQQVQLQLRLGLQRQHQLQQQSQLQPHVGLQQRRQQPLHQQRRQQQLLQSQQQQQQQQLHQQQRQQLQHQLQLLQQQQQQRRQQQWQQQQQQRQQQLQQRRQQLQ